MHDNVKHPSHYTEGRKFEPKDVIRDWDLNFNLGNAVKYIARAGRKADKIEDLKKAQQYIQFELEALEMEKPKEAPHSKGAMNCKHSMHPLFANLEGGKGENYSVVELSVPKGTAPEEIIQMVINELYGGK